MLTKLTFFTAAVAGLSTATAIAHVARGAASHDTRVESFLQGRTNDVPAHYSGLNVSEGELSEDSYDKSENTNPNLGNNIQARGMGNAIVSNRCPYDVWIWSVDQSFSSEMIKLPARSKHAEAFRSPCEGCGVSFKVSKTDALEGGKQTQFEYSIAGGQMWYDISLVDCAKGDSADDCPGHDKGLAIDSPEATCGRFDCKGDSYCPDQAYYVDFPLQKLGIADPVRSCGSAGTGMDIYFKLCSDEPALDKRSIAGRIQLDTVA